MPPRPSSRSSEYRPATAAWNSKKRGSVRTGASGMVSNVGRGSCRRESVHRLGSTGNVRSAAVMLLRNDTDFADFADQPEDQKTLSCLVVSVYAPARGSGLSAKFA